jgi:hypothetical protein
MILQLGISWLVQSWRRQLHHFDSSDPGPEDSKSDKWCIKRDSKVNGGFGLDFVDFCQQMQRTENLRTRLVTSGDDFSLIINERGQAVVLGGGKSIVLLLALCSAIHGIFEFQFHLSSSPVASFHNKVTSTTMLHAHRASVCRLRARFNAFSKWASLFNWCGVYRFVYVFASHISATTFMTRITHPKFQGQLGQGNTEDFSEPAPVLGINARVTQVVRVRVHDTW